MKSKLSIIEIICDLDHTLYYHSYLTKILFKISSFFHKSALKTLSINSNIFNKIKNKNILILTGRDDIYDKKIIIKKLQDDKITFDEIIMCPRKKLINNWKRDIVKEKLKINKNLEWYDDEKDTIMSD